MTDDDRVEILLRNSGARIGIRRHVVDAARLPLNPTIPKELAISYLHRELEEWLWAKMPRGFSTEAFEALAPADNDWLLARFARLAAVGSLEHPERNPHPDTYKGVNTTKE